MPSPYTSRQSIQDARSLAQNLNIKTLTLPIENLMHCFDQTLQPVFADRPRDVTEENIQSRIRGNLLMALSNKFGSILITTGNKSELAVGYCTIYGDMSGGLAIISDVPKTMVYRLCRWLNKQIGKDVIPASVLQKPPSAELKPDQKDEDTLPPYSILDEILNLYIEKGYSIDQIITKGFDASLVKRIADMVKKAEFKRQQAPPGLKITDRAFGTGWRMPIARK
jgi:NAD+ synthetase